MAYGNFVLDKGYDLAAACEKFRVVKATSNAEEVTKVSAATDYPLGVIQFGVITSELTRGKGASVREQGISEVAAGAAITKGVEVEIDANGRVITASGTAGRWVLGIALAAAGALDDYIPVMIARRKQ